MDIMKFVADKALVLIPALYILGRILKSVKFINDNNIPLILLVFGIGLSVWMIGFNPDGVLQGILVTGAAVYTHQLIKQSRKHKNNHYSLNEEESSQQEEDIEEEGL